jgi:hypothetical protein
MIYICVKTVLFVFLLAAISSGQKEFADIISQEIEKCQIHVTADSIAFFASREPLLAPLQKEYNILEQEYFEICDTEKRNEEVSSEYCSDLLKKYLTKRGECRELFAPLYGRACYKSQELHIGARIIIRPDCGKSKSFSVKYEKNGIKYDSTYYSGDKGWWEIEERSANAYINKISDGSKYEKFYDGQGRVTSYFWINRNNDTLVSERYFWKDGRLIKTIFNGVERNFIYGKTLQDTVKVIPSDEGLYFHSGYNNSVGKIPGENDPKYKSFIENPY